MTGYGKRAHFAQELIFQYKQLTFATPLDFVHNSESLNCFYNFSRENQLIVHLKAQDMLFQIGHIDRLSQVGPFPIASYKCVLVGLPCMGAGMYLAIVSGLTC